MVTALSCRGPRVRHLSTDNLSLGPVVPWSHDAGLTPYVVALANESGRFGTVALDFDAKLGAPGDAATDADLVMRLLDTAGIPAVMARSGPSGGHHVFVTVAGIGLGLDAARTLVQRLIALGIKTLDPSCMSSLQARIRPPGAPHRRGGSSVVVGDPDAALDRLRRDHPDAPRGADLHEFIDALAGPGAVREPLRRPDGAASSEHEERAFASGSELLQSYATRIVARGGGIAELKAFVTTRLVNDEAVRHLAEKLPKAREDALIRSVRSAQRWLAENPATYQEHVDDERVLAAWRQCDLAALNAPLGPVGVALLTRAERYGRRLVGISTRALSEESGLSEPTARRGLKTAIEAGMLEIADDGKGARARRYRLNPPELWDAVMLDAVGPSPDKGGVRMPTASLTADPAITLAEDVGAEVWFTEALGQKVRVVYLALVRLSSYGGPVSTAAVADKVGKGVRQARDDLKLLTTHGLARDLGRLGWVSEYKDPHQITDALGLTGVANLRHRQHARQRREYRLEVIEHRLRRKFSDRAVLRDTHVECDRRRVPRHPRRATSNPHQHLPRRTFPIRDTSVRHAWGHQSRSTRRPPRRPPQRTLRRLTPRH